MLATKYKTRETEMAQRSIVRIVIAAGLCMALGSFASAAEQINLTIGKLLELTAPLSETGPSQDKAIKLAIDYANKAAKQAGVPITVGDESRVSFKSRSPLSFAMPKSSSLT